MIKKKQDIDGYSFPKIKPSGFLRTLKVKRTRLEYQPLCVFQTLKVSGTVAPALGWGNCAPGMQKTVRGRLNSRCGDEKLHRGRLKPVVETKNCAVEDQICPGTAETAPGRVNFRCEDEKLHKGHLKSVVEAKNCTVEGQILSGTAKTAPGRLSSGCGLCQMQVLNLVALQLPYQRVNGERSVAAEMVYRLTAVNAVSSSSQEEKISCMGTYSEFQNMDLEYERFPSSVTALLYRVSDNTTNASRSLRHLKVLVANATEPLGVFQTLKVSESIETTRGTGKFANGRVTLAGGTVEMRGSEEKHEASVLRSGFSDSSVCWSFPDSRRIRGSVGNVKTEVSCSASEVLAEVGGYYTNASRSLRHLKVLAANATEPLAVFQTLKVSESIETTRGTGKFANGRVTLAGGTVEMRGSEEKHEASVLRSGFSDSSVCWSFPDSRRIRGSVGNVKTEVSCSASEVLAEVEGYYTNASRCLRHLKVLVTCAPQPLCVFQTLKISKDNSVPAVLNRSTSEKRDNKLNPFFLISSALYISSPAGEVPERRRGLQGGTVANNLNVKAYET